MPWASGMLWKNLILEGDKICLIMLIIMSKCLFSAQKCMEMDFHFGRKLDRAILFSSETQKAKLPKQLIA